MTKQQLVEDNMKLVYGYISKELPTYIGDEDLIQTGMLGLCKAADTWVEGQSKFSSYAYICIRNEILKELRQRNKHSGVWSLDYMITNENGEVGTFGDCVVGEEDVGYFELDAKTHRLTEKQLKIYELLLTGASAKEIAERLGITPQYVSWTRRKLRLLRGKR